jgi:hypothetical protein
LCGRTGTLYRYGIAALLLVIILSACSQKEPGKDWQAIVGPVKTRNVLDPRLAVFRVEVSADEDRVLARGEVESNAAIAELLNLLQETAAKPITDGIKVPPDPALGSRNSGLVNIDEWHAQGFVRARRFVLP